MNRFQILGILAITLLFAYCKKDSDGGDRGSAKVFEIYETLNATEAKFYENGEATGDYKEAIVLTGQWLETQPGVKAVSYEDSICIFIKMESGLLTDFCVYETDASGRTLYRGGGGGAFKSATPSGNCTNKIDNKKVLFFAAAYNDFYLSDAQSLQRVVDLFEDTDGDFEVTVLKNEQCTPEVVATFGDYGFVSLETHGMPEGFVTGVKLEIDDPASIGSAADLSAVINSKLGAQYAQWFDEGKLVIGEREYIDPLNPAWWQSGVAGTFLDHNYTISVSSLYLKSLPPMPNTIINGNMCYSGWANTKKWCNPTADLFHDNPIRLAFESLNPISYYCYAFGGETSMKVLDSDAKELLWELSKSLLDDGDSTGNAHLTNAGTFREAETNQRVLQICGPFYYKHFGQVDYCYGGCGDTLIDARDGKKYPTVCIGNQVWMAENLNWAGAGSCANGSNANCDTYGRWYKYDEIRGNDTSNTNPSGIQGVCPQGWHLPSMAEWQELFDFLGTDAGGKLKAINGWASPNVGATNSTGFGALGGGYLFNGTWEAKDESAVFGTTTMITQAGLPYFRVALIYNSTSDAFASTLGGSTLPTDDLRVNCRCVKD